MDALIMALAPAFAAGLAVQRILDIFDQVLDALGQGKLKKAILGVISFAAGLAVAVLTNIRVLRPLGGTGNDVIDLVATALVVSAGTESLNSILKFLSYKKDEQKAETAEKMQVAESVESTRTMMRAI